MSTVYTFQDETGEYHVFKHSDGYPEGAAIAINKALPYAWPLPRFEANEFAAAFVCGNKVATARNAFGLQGGDVRLLPSGSINDVAPGDIEYRYEIFFSGRKLRVSAFSIGPYGEKLIISCPLVDFADRAKAQWLKAKDVA